MKKLLNSSSLLIGLILILAGVMANRKTINGVTEQAIARVLPDDNYAEQWQVKPGSIYDGDTLRVVRGSSELKIRNLGSLEHRKRLINRNVFYYKGINHLTFN